MTDTIVNVSETFNLSEAGTMSGVSPLVRRQYSPQRKHAIVEASRLLDRVFNQGDPRAAVLLQEALSTSDLFKSAVGDVLDQELLARYEELPSFWQNFASRTTVRNFKPKRLVDLLGGRNALEVVPELAPYPTAKATVAEKFISVSKFGRRFGFSWEAGINDDIDELMAIPGAFAAAARATEDKAANDQLFDAATGAPNTAFFANLTGATPAGPDLTPVTGTNAPLTQGNLQAAYTAVMTRKNAEGELNPPAGLVLMVGPALQITAEQILNTTEIRDTSGNRTTITTNPMNGKVTLVVNPRLAGVAWFLLPQPTVARPALAVAFLRGWETPDLRIKADGGNRLGGGAVDPTEGAFDDDSVAYRVRHVVGSAQADPLHTFASAGA
jgi:hypothetical protein